MFLVSVARLVMKEGKGCFCIHKRRKVLLRYCSAYAVIHGLILIYSLFNDTVLTAGVI
jgi:hypothetical protein